MAPKRAATPLELLAIEDVRGLARGFDGSPEKIAEVRAATTGKQRFLATRFTPPGHPDFAPLMAMLDALIATDDEVVTTTKGVFRKADLIDAECRLTREDGANIIQFPIRHPWESKPNRETGKEGVRAPAVYRPRGERTPVYGTFQSQPHGPATKREREWWEGEP